MASIAYREKIANYLIVNFIAEYQYIFYLFTGRRAHALSLKDKLSDQEQQYSKIWLPLAHVLVENCALAVAMFSQQTEPAAKQCLLSFINVERLLNKCSFL